MGRKSAKIADKKGAADKARGQLYTRALKDVFKASKSGSPEVGANFLLKVAVERAKKLNVPKDNIEKAIKKGQGSDGVGFEDISYEGYGPSGVAIFVEASTDNPTRTVSNVRSYFKKCDGTLGVAGSLEFVFNRIARFIVPAEGIDEDDFTLSMIDAGAEDVERSGKNFFSFWCHGFIRSHSGKAPRDKCNTGRGFLIRIPLNRKAIDDEDVLDQIDRLVDLLEADDDVVAVYHNLEEEEDEE